MSEVKVMFPAGHLGFDSREPFGATAMRLIAVAFGDPDSWPEKYGADYENDVFLMKPFCWCERNGECPWCTGCHCPDENWEDRGEKYKTKVRRTCDYCTGGGIFQRFAPWTSTRSYYDPPNFWFKPANVRVTWYKYIGRDMKANVEAAPPDMLAAVLAGHPDGWTVERALEILAERQKETSRVWSNMLARLRG